jgi:transposase
VDGGGRHHVCKACDHKRRYPSSSAAITSSSAPSLPPPLFDRDSSPLTPLSTEQRWTIIVLHKQGQQRAAIASKIPCSLKTVGHWINHYEKHGSVEDKRRSGRKRKTDENTDVNIITTAIEKKFITPKKIKRELQLSVSADTIRRRLDEARLFGRVARKEYPFTAEHIRKRLSFANGYGKWTEDQWDTVLFSDETHIELGQHGQVWVQRPLGAAFDSDYMTNKVPHPDRVSVWGCFSGRGLGQIEIFTDILDGPTLKAILQRHLLPSANSLFPPGAWWLQQDNDPKHRSILVRDWLFSNGVQCLDFPPYSPDLNPIENLWNDLKRRVEKRNARDIAELEEHLNAEWSATDRDYLVKLSHSMPKRCLAVVANHGHKTRY